MDFDQLWAEALFYRLYLETLQKEYIELKKEELRASTATIVGNETCDTQRERGQL